MVNFDIIHYKCGKDSLKTDYKNYKTVQKSDFNNYSNKKEKNVLSAVFRNKKDDLWVEHDVVLKHFRENFNDKGEVDLWEQRDQMIKSFKGKNSSFLQ